MKCKNCGHLNKSNTYYCVKCGSSLESSSPIRQYKQFAKDDSDTPNLLSKTQKFLIALVIIGILIVILSAVIPPDLEMPGLSAPVSQPEDNQVEIIDNVTNKLNTTIKVGEIGAKTGEKVTVNAYVTDENGDAVTGGTASINLFDVKYSGQVENGNVKVVLPELSENNYETTIVYEGNDKYNPSETQVSISINKENTKLEAENKGDNIIITLKTEGDKPIPNAKLVITGDDNTQKEEQTDSNGQINIKIDEPGKHKIKVNYLGDDKYNPSETVIEVGNERIDTKLDTKYDEKEKSVTVTLLDKDNDAISDATLIITNNGNQTQEITDSNGMIKIPLTTGENRVIIKYEGNDTYNGAETIVNTVIDDNKTENDTVNDTTETDTKDNTTTENSTVENITTDKNDTNSTEKEAVDTTFEVENKDDQIKITLLTEDNQNLSGEKVKIILDNGTEMEETTDTNGSILLDVDIGSINEIKLEYEGNNPYNSHEQIVKIKH